MHSYSINATPEMKERLFRFLSENDYQFTDVFVKSNPDGKTNFILIVDDPLPKFIPMENLIDFTLIKTFGIEWSSSAPETKIEQPQVVYSGVMQIREDPEDANIEMSKLSIQPREQPKQLNVVYKGKLRNIEIIEVSPVHKHLVRVHDLDANDYIRTYDIKKLKQENPNIQFNF
jgi:hypothetical protein